MKLWKLYARTPGEGSFGWDTHHGFVIRAEDESKARELAAKEARDNVWLDNDFTTCAEIFAHGEQEIILQDYNAG